MLTSFLTIKALQILPLTAAFLFLHPITTPELSESPFLPPEKPCGRRWALRKILTGTQSYPKHALLPWVANLCQTHAQPRHNPRRSPTDAELSLAGCSLGRVPQPFPAITVQFCRSSLRIQGLTQVPNWGTAGNSCLREEGCQTSILFALPWVSVNAFSRTKPNGKSAKEAAAGGLGCRIPSPHVPSRSL